MILIKNLFKKYDMPVLQDINLKIEDASIFGLIGVNGAGKTTLLNMLSGIMKSDRGSILFDDLEVYENNLVKKDIFYLPDEPYYTMNTTPKNLLTTYKMFYEVDEEEYFEYLKGFKLPNDKSMYNFSKGMKRQVFVSLALAIKPKYLFLDETFDGLDPISRLTLKRELVKLVDEVGTTVVITSHSLRELSDICDSYGIINKTHIMSYGELDKIMEKYHKYTLAFDMPYEEKDFDFPMLDFKKDKRIINCITILDHDSLKEKIKSYNPIVFEEQPLDFEERFMVEAELNKTIKKYHKYALAFKTNMEKSDFPIKFINFNKDEEGIIYCVTLYDYASMKKIIRPLNPTIFVELEFDFKEECLSWEVK